MSLRKGRAPILWLLSLLLIAGPVFGAIKFFTNRKPPEKRLLVDRGVLVDTIAVERQSHEYKIIAQGTVIPAQRVSVSPEVTGRVIRLSDDLVAGGFVKKGQVLFSIDPTDLEINVAESRTAVEQAETKIELERGQRAVAEKEWALFNRTDGDDSDSALALRKPQMRAAEVNLEAAQARQRRAKVNLSRTTIRAPFDAVVQRETIERGQLVSPQSQVATLVGTGAFWVQLSVPVDELAYIDIPGVNTTEGSKAQILDRNGPTKVEREGRIVRLLPDLDPAGRMARVLVEIDDPFGLQSAEDRRGMPLLLDSWVTVHLAGNQSQELIEIPRRAVRDGSNAYVAKDGLLSIQLLDIAWRRETTVLVRTGLENKDKVIVSPISMPVAGLKLRELSEIEVTP